MEKHMDSTTHNTLDNTEKHMDSMKDKTLDNPEKTYYWDFTNTTI